MKKKIFVLHEYGARSHYIALEYLLKLENIGIDYFEFSIIKKIIKSFVKIDWNLLKKQFINLKFMYNLLFSKNKKILLGIAPYDYRLLILYPFLKHHKIYYHTSWHVWNKKFYPKKFLVNKYIINFWEWFLKNKVKEIFCVTKKAKESIVKNLEIDKRRIKVVYHGYDNKIFYLKKFNRYKYPSFLFVGRLVPEKGLEELLEFFSKKSYIFTIVGDGKLKTKVLEYSKKSNNIRYLGTVNNKRKLADIYNVHHFFLLNSKRTSYWEELFGISIIEAMACGVVPITTNHVGPSEIIEHGKDGFIFEEDSYLKNLKNIISRYNEKMYKFMQKLTVKKAEKFKVENVSKNWIDILK